MRSINAFPPVGPKPLTFEASFAEAFAEASSDWHQREVGDLLAALRASREEQLRLAAKGWAQVRLANAMVAELDGANPSNRNLTRPENRDGRRAFVRQAEVAELRRLRQAAR